MLVKQIPIVTSLIGDSMLYCYGGSFTGHSHQEKGIPCQDSSFHGILQNGSALLIVADGVGSSKHSDIASNIAVQSVYSYLSNLDKIDENSIEEAYTIAQESIEKHCLNEGSPFEDYDTTLSTVVFDGSGIVYGHSGDGGILAILRSGEYISVTHPQKGEDGTSVIPLRFGKEYWIIGSESGPFSSVLAMTDGVLDGLMMPGILRLSDNPIYIPMVRYFADNNVLCLDDTSMEDVESSRMDFINGPSCQSITDDRTLVVAVDAEHNPEILTEDYYAEPDFEALMLKWRQCMYPHLGDQN